MKIYLASSWRTLEFASVLKVLRAEGYDVYDFRENGFPWADCESHRTFGDPTPSKVIHMLNHEVAKEGFKHDLAALEDCDVLIWVVPEKGGKSSALETGWAVGAGKRTCALLLNGEPELMLRLLDSVVTSVEDLVEWCSETANWLREQDRD